MARNEAGKSDNQLIHDANFDSKTDFMRAHGLKDYEDEGFQEAKGILDAYRESDAREDDASEEEIGDGDAVTELESGDDSEREEELYSEGTYGEETGEEDGVGAEDQDVEEAEDGVDGDGYGEDDDGDEGEEQGEDPDEEEEEDDDDDS
jgi:hypothetical protein